MDKFLLIFCYLFTIIRVMIKRILIVSDDHTFAADLKAGFPSDRFSMDMSNTVNKEASAVDMDELTQSVNNAKLTGVANHFAATGFDEDQTTALLGKYTEQDNARATRIGTQAEAIMHAVNNPE